MINKIYLFEYIFQYIYCFTRLGARTHGAIGVQGTHCGGSTGAPVVQYESRSDVQLGAKKLGHHVFSRYSSY